MYYSPVKTVQGYTREGLFGALRKYDIHTGLDLYTVQGEPVRVVKSGVVKEVIQFTGSEVGTPWWNKTYAVVVEDNEGCVWVYGELDTYVSKGQKVTTGQYIGFITPVLKTDKGKNPTTMLHLEIWESNYQSNFTWKHGEPCPKGLVNPIKYLHNWIIKSNAGYKIYTYSGEYIMLFSSAVDCKAYCMNQKLYYDESFVYVNTPELKTTFKQITGKVYV